jgi:diketogulonate reductase-like aldo/keto reductase
MLFAATLSVALAADPIGKNILLNDGYAMPRISLGTCCGSKPSVGVGPWLKAGGVGIDTAVVYKNSPDIAKALVDSGTDRGDVYLTSKVLAGCGDAGDCAADSNVSMTAVRQMLKDL